MTTPVPSADGVPAPATSPRFGYLPTLDGWRAVAIGLVLLAHGSDSIRRFFPPVVVRHLGPMENYGWVGVQLFFALSGFLICSRLLDERSRRGWIDLRQFYLRRVFRILPPALTFLAVAGLLGLVGVIPMSVRNWVVSVLCLSNYIRPDMWYLGHFWSLAVEEHFYLLWPGLLALTGTWRRGLTAAVTLALADAFWRAFSYKFGLYANFPSFQSRTDLQADALLWGCALAFVYVDPWARDRLAALLRPAGWAVALATLVAAATWAPPDWKIRQVTLVVFRLCAPLVIVGTVLHPTGPVGRLLEWRPLRIVGRLSYSTYLWQQLFVVLDNCRVPALGFLQSLPWNLLATAACATASYWLVEQPLIRLGHRLTPSRPPARPPQSPAAPVPFPATPQPRAGVDLLVNPR
jgi:peptidoglycan/LPS O-acetylase OafA/YrhL